MAVVKLINQTNINIYGFKKTNTVSKKSCQKKNKFNKNFIYIGKYLKS